MGIVESRILAKTLLTACDQAEKEGKRQLDEARLWQDTETVRISKSIYKYIPRTIRHTPRQPAIRKAIARSSDRLQVSQVVQGLQDKHESLFSLHSPGRAENHSGPSATLQLAPSSCYVQPPLQTSSLADFYNFIIYCEQQQELGKIRLRILYVAFFRLKNAIQPGTQYQYDDISLFIAHAIRSLGCKDSLSVIESRVRLWVGRGERYDLIARDLGGLGALYILPEDGGESLWTKELPKSATKPNRIAMIKHLREQGLPEEAERRGLHILAEGEVANVLRPTKAALDQVIENHLSEANFQVPSDDGRPRGTGDDWLQSRLPQFCQASAGTPGAPAPLQSAAHVDSLYNAINNGQGSSTEMVQGVRQLPYGPAVTQVSLPNQPDLMGTPVQAHTLRPGDMPTAPTQFETHGPCHRNATSENSAQFNGEQNGHVQYSELMGVTRNPIATITPADFPQAFAATSTLVPADYPQVFPYQRRTVTPADYPLMYPCGPSPYLGCSTSQPVVQSL